MADAELICKQCAAGTQLEWRANLLPLYCAVGAQKTRALHVQQSGARSRR